MKRGRGFASIDMIAGPIHGRAQQANLGGKKQDNRAAVPRTRDGSLNKDGRRKQLMKITHDNQVSNPISPHLVVCGLNDFFNNIMFTAFVKADTRSTA